MSSERTFALALIGTGIGGSLTPAMQEREGRAQGLSVTYRRVDLAALGLGVGDLPDVLRTRASRRSCRCWTRST